MQSLQVVESRARSEEVCFRGAQPGDIPAINELFIREYGHQYPYLLNTLPAIGAFIVAESSDGHVIAFGRASSYHGYKRVWEFGGLITHTWFRQNGIAKEITRVRLDQARAAGVIAVVSEPVCYRQDCASQENLLKQGFVMLGIQPFKYPDIKEKHLGAQPESVMLAVQYLYGDSGFGCRVLHLPDALKDVPSMLVDRRVLARDGVHHPTGSMPKVEWHKPRYGVSTHGSIFADVPVNWPEAKKVTSALLEDGWRFAAFLPGFGETEDGQIFDYIRLYQPPTKNKLSFDRVHVAAPMIGFKEFMRVHDPVAQ